VLDGWCRVCPSAPLSVLQGAQDGSIARRFARVPNVCSPVVRLVWWRRLHVRSSSRVLVQLHLPWLQQGGLVRLRGHRESGLDIPQEWPDALGLVQLDAPRPLWPVSQAGADRITVSVYAEMREGRKSAARGSKKAQTSAVRLFSPRISDESPWRAAPPAREAPPARPRAKAEVATHAAPSREATVGKRNNAFAVFVRYAVWPPLSAYASSNITASRASK
jgi:hypothetical protein